MTYDGAKELTRICFRYYFMLLLIWPATTFGQSNVIGWSVHDLTIGDAVFVVTEASVSCVRFDGSTVEIPRGTYLLVEELAPNNIITRYLGKQTLIKPHQVMPKKLARDYFEAETRRDPVADNWAIKGRIEFSLHHFEAAASDFSEAILREPNHLLAHAFRGSILVSMGMRGDSWDTVSGHLRKTVAQLKDTAPESFYPYSLEFFIHEKNNDLEKALASINKAIEAAPHRAFLIANKGTVLLKQKKDAEAIECFKSAIELEPAHYSGYYYMGYYLQRQNENDQARAYLLKSIERSSRNYWSRYYLAELARKDGRLEEYAQHLKVATTSYRCSKIIKRKYAWLLATCSDDSIRDGPAALERAMKLFKDSLNPSERSHATKILSAAYAETGDFERAIEALDAVNERRADGPELREMRQSFLMRVPHRVDEF